MTSAYDYDLSGRNTLGLPSVCRHYVETSSTADTQTFVRDVLLAGGRPAAGGTVVTPHIVLGGGSNMLLAERVDDVVVHPAVSGLTVERRGDDAVVSVGGGVAWDDVVQWAVDEGYWGGENLSGIPGTVGATAVQNIGAYGAEVCRLIAAIEAVDTTTGDVVSIEPAACRYGYRSSRFKDDWRGRYIVTAVSYRLSRRPCPLLDYGDLGRLVGQRPTAAAVRRAVLAVRGAKLPDPAVEGNAGSFFMNPVVSRELCARLAERYPAMPHYAVDGGEKVPAAWLIEQCGWKGATLGRAGVHARQALVLVNRGGATAGDMLRLMAAIQDDVLRRFGIALRPEVVIVGERERG